MAINDYSVVYATQQEVKDKTIKIKCYATQCFQSMLRITIAQILQAVCRYH